MSLYEPAAVFGTGPGESQSGVEGIRNVLSTLIADGAVIELSPRHIHVVDDLAVLSNEATVRPTPGADPVHTTTTEVVRRQRNGRWLYVIDDPFFAAGPGQLR